MFIAGEIALILSHHSRWIRISLSPLLFTGVMMMHAIVHGFCMLLTLSSERELRQWEMFADDEEEVAPLEPWRHAPPDTAASSFTMEDLKSPTTSMALSVAAMGKSETHLTTRAPSHSDSGDAVSHTSRSTATLKSRLSRMSPFGAGNAFDGETWVRKWDEVTWWRKGVFTFSVGKVPSMEQGINGIHRHVMWLSVYWATATTVGAMIVLVALPVVGLY